MTATGSAADSTLALATELTATTDDTATYVQKSAPIAQFDTQRGISLKEMYAVRQSGMTYSPEGEEMMAGTIRLRALLQRMLLTGNASTSAGAGAATELGAYNAAFFDGLRMITGGLGAHNASAVRVDQDQTTKGGPFTLTQAINLAAAQQIDNGGEPSVILCSATAKNALMNEQEGKQRTDTAELIPGVQVQTVTTVAGDLPVVMIPGGAAAVGTYNRTSDSALVEDLYILDESSIYVRWLGSEDINVLEIPAGVDGKLSRRFILFGLFGLQVVDDGLFQAKVRRLAS